MASLSYNSSTRQWAPSYSYTDYSNEELRSDRPETEEYQEGSEEIDEVTAADGLLRYEAYERYLKDNYPTDGDGNYTGPRDEEGRAPNRPSYEDYEQIIASRGPRYRPTVKKTRVLYTNGVPNSVLNADGRTYQAAKRRAEAENNAINTLIQRAQGSRGGDYVSVRDGFRNTALGLQANGYSQSQATGFKTNLLDAFKDFYRTEKLQKWDSALGAKPAYGDFDASYYASINSNATQRYIDAYYNDDIDITERYTPQSYLLWDYTTQGKSSGLRGNKAEVTTQANRYVEKKPTDRDLQDVRDLQLGVDTQTQTQRLLNVPEIAAEWDKAKKKDPYWSQQAKEKFLDPSKPDDFAILFRLSERPEDKQIKLNYNVNAGYGVTQLEDELNKVVGEKTIIDVKKFGALAQNVLKDSIAELKKVKVKEQTISMMRGFSGFSEIADINKTLANTILGDSGVGGILSFTSAGKAEESLNKSLQNITGVQNNATYNWQQWFDTALKEKYNKEIELGYTAGEAKEQIKIEGEFASNFINTYLKPRFDTSRSMNEFIEYLDVRQEEQNPFQTQDLLNATSQVANLRAQAYLDKIKSAGDSYFNAEFYFNPIGNSARQDFYSTQASTVAADWEAAKRGDEYWATQAYRFGVDINNKDAFARMHFQVKGQGRGYDPAEDILTAGKVQDEIFNNILPAIKAEALKQGTVFGQFVTPEEFTDELLRGLDPNDKSGWSEILQRYGLTEFKGTIEELKEYIKETLRTGSAQEIREQLKYLNEKRQKPTQQVLGLSYIERPEDFKDTQPKSQTELYRTFQSAGFQGTENEFYNNFFPDVDRSEQALLTKAGSNQPLKTTGLDFTDPFASLGTVESFFNDEATKYISKPEKTTTGSNTKTNTNDASSFFSLGSDEEDTEYKSVTGQKILGEFTSLFKGL
jgi:hypothetical protein